MVKPACILCRPLGKIWQHARCDHMMWTAVVTDPIGEDFLDPTQTMGSSKNHVRKVRRTHPINEHRAEFRIKRIMDRKIYHISSPC